ncbi:MAG: septum formation initiator family protein [Tannerella sp.]|jgi:cell division protein FtsB|nr:septum formation initiator family protein [Tannerella sp.]
MSRISNFFDKCFCFLRLNWSRLLAVAILVCTFVFGDSNLYVRFRYENKIRELEREIRYYRKEVEISKRKLDGLQANRERLERYAREEFFMKNPNEDIFIIVEK